MRLTCLTLAVLLVGGCAGSAADTGKSSQIPAKQDILTPAGVILLPGVVGRLDHMAADAAGKRLFVAALENHSLEVIDLDKARPARSVPGIKEPQGLLYLPQSRQLLVCSRGDGTCRSFDTDTFAEGPWVDLGTNADNVRFDAGSGTVYVGSGGEPGPGALSAIDAAALLPRSKGGKPAPARSGADLLMETAGRVDAKAQVGLGSHPESFQLAPDGRQVFVNVPDDHGVAVIDVTDQGLKLSATWPIAQEKNFPMAVDPKAQRLFVVCRKPARLLCLDTQTGKELSSADCVGDCDDVYYDPAAGRLYVFGGEGFIDVFSVAADTSRLERIARVPTAAKARTGLFIPQLGLLCVAAPKTSQNDPARILLFKIAK